MKEIKLKRIRLSIDLDEKEYRELRVVSALYGESVREYVLKSIRESVNHGVKKRELNYLINNVVVDPVLKDFWEKENVGSLESVRGDKK